MKKLLPHFIYSIVILILFSFLVYPTMYYYTTFESGSGFSFPVKVNRFTGTVEIFNPTRDDGGGWTLYENE